MKPNGRQNLPILIALGVLILMILSCSQSIQEPVQTAVSLAGQTAVAVGVQTAKTQAAALIQTAQFSAPTEAARLMGTAQVAAGTAAVRLIQTVQVSAPTEAARLVGTAKVSAPTEAARLVGTAKVSAPTEAAKLLQTAQAVAGTQSSNLVQTLSPDTPIPFPTPQPSASHVLVQPPFETCSGKSDQPGTPPGDDMEVLSKGFSYLDQSCDAGRGAVNTAVLLFGGRSGNIFSAPNYMVEVSSGMEIHYTPAQNGNLRIVAHLTANGKTGASAGSGAMIPEVKDLLQGFLPPEQIGMLADLDKAFRFEPAAALSTDAYLSAVGGSYRVEATAPFGGHDFSASFPIPPWSQKETFVDQPLTLTITTPVQANTTYTIGVGLRTKARVYGWAFCWWNLVNRQESIINSIEITEE